LRDARSPRSSRTLLLRALTVPQHGSVAIALGVEKGMRSGNDVSAAAFVRSSDRVHGETLPLEWEL
jgi:hypothetical protein